MILRQAVRFGLIGIVATLVHMVVGAGLIALSWPPLLANVAAFCVAFLVSFGGHFWYSFAGHSATIMGSLKRFLPVALLGFGVNQSLLALLTLTGMLPATPALMLSTGVAAVGTFILSRLWAFR